MPTDRTGLIANAHYRTVWFPAGRFRAVVECQERVVAVA